MDNQNPTPNPTPTPPTENIPAQNTAVPQTPPQAYTAPQPAAPPPSPKSFLSTKIILLIVILLIVLGAGGTYLALNSKPKPQPIVPKPTPTSAPIPTIDPTASWETFVDDANNLTIKYPADWIILSAGGTKIAEQTLQEYVTEEENALAKPGLPGLKILPPDNDSKRKPVAQHEMIARETKNKFLGRNVLVADILKDTITVVTVQAFPSSRISKDEPFSIKDKRTFNQILSTFKFTETSPTPTCRPRPACLDATPQCLIPETPDMCRPSITPPPGGGIVCTQEAKLCPDGKTYVGRQGPKCEFAPCPGQ